MAVQQTGNVTIADIAEEVECSPTTVSFVLRGKAKDRNISDKTAERVIETARRLKYVPNVAARALRCKRTGFIGVMVASFMYESQHKMIQDLRNTLYADEGGYHPLIALHEFDPVWEKREINFLFERQVEAIISIPARAENYRPVVSMGLPLVFYGRRLENMPEVSSIMVDPKMAIKKAVEHLVACGRRSIGLVGWKSTEGFHAERIEGYVEGLYEAGLDVHDEWIASLPMGTPCHEAVKSIFSNEKQRPDGLIVSHEQPALDVQEALDSLGLSMPQDVNLIAYGNHRRYCGKRVGITSIMPKDAEVGSQLAEIVLRQINDRGHEPVNQMISDFEVIQRQTTSNLSQL